VARNTNPGMEWRPDTASQPLFIVSDPGYLWCWIDAPEQAIGALHQGMKVKLHSNAWPNESFEGEIDFIEDALDPASHTLKARAKVRNSALKLKLHSNAWPNESFEGEIDFIEDALDPASHTLKARAKVRNSALKLKSEMYVTAEFDDTAKETMDIPVKAVFLKDASKMVFVKTADGIFTRKAITPVATSDAWVSITEGLNKGDQVVVDGALYLEKMIEENRTPQVVQQAPETGHKNAAGLDSASAN